MNQSIISQNNKQPRSFGFIYVLQNIDMPDVYKVGMTTRSPHARAAELSSATGVPAPFEVIYYAEVANPEKEERRVHLELHKYRVTRSREFFRADLLTIVKTIQNLEEVFLESALPVCSEWIRTTEPAIEKIRRSICTKDYDQEVHS